MSNFQVIATLNTHLLNKETLQGLQAAGATIFRINGSHIQPSELEIYSRAVRGALGSGVKLLVDLPGNKIRTGILSQPIILKSGGSFEIYASQFNYTKFLSHLSVGDVLLANDSLFKFRVESVNPEKATLFSFTDGELKSNKGVHLIGKEIDLPFLFDRDQQLIDSAIKNDFDYIGYSFVRTAEDVNQANLKLNGTKLKPIIKVETAPAIKNLDAILDRADHFLVDRGDLSCDVGIHKIDDFQKMILRAGKAKGKKIYFATQFFHSMLENPVPLIAEVCGFSDAYSNGVDGIQLSEETAVGKHPKAILDLILKIRKSISESVRARLTKKDFAQVLWLTGPSGSGKSTISAALISELKKNGLNVAFIDGDEFREFFGNELSYSKEDRIRNQKSIIFSAAQAAKVFDVVVVASLSPFREIREFARGKMKNFHEIFVDCPIDECRKRDPKGHYARMSAGANENFVGLNSDYEQPLRPELRLESAKLSVGESKDLILRYLLGSK